MEQTNNISIRSKQDVINVFGVCRDTFNKTIRPALLVHLDWKREKYIKMHKSHFDIETVLKIKEFIEKYETIL